MKSCVIELLYSYENNLEVFDVNERLFVVITLYAGDSPLIVLL
jgi:hypothetical protein